MPPALPSLSGVCEMCTSRVKVREDGTLWRHRRKPSKPAVCARSGRLPRRGQCQAEVADPDQRECPHRVWWRFESDRRRH